MKRGVIAQKIMSWNEAKKKLESLFSDEVERGTIKGVLLNKSEAKRLEYFEGSDIMITAALRTLLPNTLPGNYFVTRRWGVDKAYLHFFLVFLLEGERAPKRFRTELHKVLNQLGYDHAIVNNQIDLDILSPEERASVIAEIGQTLFVQDPFQPMVMEVLRLKQLKDDQKQEPKGLDIIGDQGGKNLPVLGMPQMFVRPVYKTLYDIISRAPRNLIHLSGSSGVGKSCFLVYLAIRLLSESSDTTPKIIILQAQDRRMDSWYCFAGTKAARRGAIEDFEPFLFLPDTLYLADGVVNPMISNAKSIVALSPNSLLDSGDESFQTYAKTCITYYMPPWTKTELEDCRKVLFADFPSDLMINLFEKAGGVPRYVLNVAAKEWRDAQNKQDYDIIESKALERFYLAFKQVGNAIKLLQCLRGNARFKKYSNRLIHAWNADEDFREPFFDFATPYVFKRLQENVTEETARFVLYQLADQSFRKSTHRGKLFELYVLYLFRKGGLTFSTRKLNVKGHGNETLTIPISPKVHTFKDIIIPRGSSNELFIPLFDNHSATDFILTPDKLFQVTVNVDHPVKKAALSEIIQKMRTSNPSVSEFSLYFVVPEDIYETYPPQKYSNVDGSVAQNLTKELRKTQQWGIKVDIAAMHQAKKE
jgi:hypothetical protein